MLKILNELYLSKKMACIYANCNDTSKFHFGIIKAVNDIEIAIEMFLPNGENDGVMVIGLDCINRVEINSQYVEKMKKICSNEPDFLRKLQIDNNNISKNILWFAFKEKQILSVELLNSGYNDVVGRIEEIDDTICRVQQFNEYGYMDGESYFYVKDVTKITVLTQEEIQIMKLIKGTQGDGSPS